MHSTWITGNFSLCCHSLVYLHASICSGDISLDELKIGLSKLSIFMYPYELREVMNLIDKDGSGFLELDEMEAVFGL